MLKLCREESYSKGRLRVSNWIVQRLNDDAVNETVELVWDFRCQPLLDFDVNLFSIPHPLPYLTEAQGNSLFGTDHRAQLRRVR